MIGLGCQFFILPFTGFMCVQIFSPTTVEAMALLIVRMHSPTNLRSRVRRLIRNPWEQGHFQSGGIFLEFVVLFV